MTLTQPHLFDVARATEARDAAIAQVDENADLDWKLEALRVIYHICRVRELFTSDPVWALLDARNVEGPHEPKALGAVLMVAKRRGWCRPTNEYVNSSRVECHRRPLRIWQSAGPLLPSWDENS